VPFGSLCWKLRMRPSEMILDVPKFMVLQFWCILGTGTGLDWCFYVFWEVKRILISAQRY
ncbi:unnamed protein product, partial [Coccothraustes coccothraustes]